MHDFYMLADVARILRVKPYRIVYLLTSGQIPDVMRLGGRRIFTFDDMVRLADCLQVQVAAEFEAKESRRDK